MIYQPNYDKIVIKLCGINALIAYRVTNTVEKGMDKNVKY